MEILVRQNYLSKIEKYLGKDTENSGICII